MAPSIEKVNTFGSNHTLTPLRTSREENDELHLSPVYDGDILFRNGLRNLGNTCFLNSAVQMLFSLENGLIEDLLHPCGNISDISAPEKKKLNKSSNTSLITNGDKNIHEKHINNINAKERSEGRKEASDHRYYCCPEFPFHEELATLLCWPSDQAIAELTSEEVEENAKELRDALVQIGKKLMHTDTCTYAVDPTPIKRAIDAKTKQFAGYNQHDSHEFFTAMIDMLSDEEKESEAKDNSDHELMTDWQTQIEMKKEENKKSVVDLHFGSHVKVTLMCSKCGHKRSRNEIYRHLSLDLNLDSTSTIEDSLKMFFEPEDREVKCEHCDSEHAVEYKSFIKLPNALLLHLKRFIVDIGPNFMLRYRKNNQKVEFMRDLDLEPYYTRDSKDMEDEFICSSIMFANFFPNSNEEEDIQVRETSKYKLKSVIHHLGTSANRGHYTADVLTRNNEVELCLRCSDSVVTPSTDIENTILGEKSQKEAYMIMYERVKE